MHIAKYDNTDIEKHLEEFEKKYNFTFPDQYRKFLLKYNGGDTPKTEFKFNRREFILLGFYGLGNVRKVSNYECIDSWLLEIEFKDNVIRIGSIVHGDKVLIGLEGEIRGKIYLRYSHGPKKYIKLCDDFKSFTEMCKSEEIGHIETIEERIENMKKLGREAMIEELMPMWKESIEYYKNVKLEELVVE